MSEYEETFVIRICDFKTFDIKTSLCDVQMDLIAINVENSICPRWQLPCVADVQVTAVQVAVVLEQL